MAVFKCKMCGGNLEFTDGQSYGTCDSCGSTMTLPRGNDERVINLFNRATHYRQQNEFDKAIATYESILEEDSENAEAYWGLVLSKYGIEYVEDPKTHKRIPTCHRLQHDSILSDLDYQSALKYAIDSHAQRLYKEEAEKISEIQKNILSVANKEAAYDIFICYKESDNSGKRTIDSVLAQDIYTNLTNEGYKVFFSRITLEDKLGQEYEPYIFAALHSAKVMLVVGTNKDNFNAVWVKNEWSRFLALSKKDKSKLIIPCYRDMDAYDLPDELSMFQSQDMNKIGFMQDLTRGIKKVVGSQTSSEFSVSVDYKKLLKRANILLESGDFEEALTYFDKILDNDTENSKAYWGRFMCKARVKTETELLNDKYFLDKSAGNIPDLTTTGISLETFYSNYYNQYAKNENPTLGLFPDYQNAVKFSSGEEREHYMAINKQLIQNRAKIFTEVKVRHNNMKEMSGNTGGEWIKYFLLTLLGFGVFVAVIALIASNF